ncbi:hypothetical protein MKX01_041132 [Papaver californicum]|nr:hypothetical protein MKX01_041132 [Papaver californicum]
MMSPEEGKGQVSSSIGSGSDSSSGRGVPTSLHSHSSLPLNTNPDSMNSIEMVTSFPSRTIFLGVDVGTGSARAGLFDDTGKLLGSASSPIHIWKDHDCVEGCTCSQCMFLAAVAVDADGSPVTFSLSGDARRNVIVWMDHRAIKQAERINTCNSPVLQYCGGAVSPEMQPPKDDDFWEEIGLGDLVDGHHAKIGRSVAFPGIPVGTSLIDAHAGGVGVLESKPILRENSKEDDKENICHRMVLVCGTSTCHMTVSRSKLFIPGVWGPSGQLTNGLLMCCIQHSPYLAMVPEYWLTEGGQSATGSLLDYIIDNHVAAPLLANRISLMELLNKILETQMNDFKAPSLSALTEDLHVLPTIMEIGCPIILPREKDSVLLGAAILGAVAAKMYFGLHDAMKALNASGQIIHPSANPNVKKFHDAKYRVFKELYEQQLSHRIIMNEALS